jgi:hypothetical protein
MGEYGAVYVALLDEGTNVWRPVLAHQVGPRLFRLSGPVPADKSWQFQPGELVRCEIRRLSGGPVLVVIQSTGTT